MVAIMAAKHKKPYCAKSGKCHDITTICGNATGMGTGCSHLLKSMAQNNGNTGISSGAQTEHAGANWLLGGWGAL